MGKFIQKHNLMPGYNNLTDILRDIEDGFRIGANRQGRPKQLLVKFYSTRVRNTIMRISKQTDKKKAIDPVYMQDED